MSDKARRFFAEWMKLHFKDIPSWDKIPTFTETMVRKFETDASAQGLGKRDFLDVVVNGDLYEHMLYEAERTARAGG